MTGEVFCVIDCNSAEEFLHELEEIHPRWRGRTWIFRGQNDSSWCLLPPSLRLKFTYEYVSKFCGSDSLPLKNKEADTDCGDPRRYNLHSTYLHIVTEQRLVEAFISLADRCGLSLPYENINNINVVKNMEDRLKIERLHEEYLYMFSASTFPDSVEYALAQHYRVPTRLLDFTYRPFFAAFFAANLEEKLCKQPERIIVWAISLGAIQSTSLKIVRHRRTQIGFLQAQDGLFIYDTMANEKCKQLGTWQPIETQLKSKGNKVQVYKLTLPFSKRIDVLRLLRLKHITKPMLMPSFENVAEEIRECPEFWNELMNR